MVVAEGDQHGTESLPEEKPSVVPDPYSRGAEHRPVMYTADHVRNMSFSLDVCATRIDYSNPAVTELFYRGGYSLKRRQSLARQCAIESCKLHTSIESRSACRVRSMAAVFRRHDKIGNTTVRPSALQPCQQRETPVVVS